MGINFDLSIISNKRFVDIRIYIGFFYFCCYFFRLSHNYLTTFTFIFNNYVLAT